MEALTGLWFDGQNILAPLCRSAASKNHSSYLMIQRIGSIFIFKAKTPDFTPPLSFDTTLFRHTVWDILLSIPYGHTMTYGEIADMVAKQNGLSKMSAQAVGGAVGITLFLSLCPAIELLEQRGA